MNLAFAGNRRRILQVFIRKYKNAQISHKYPDIKTEKRPKTYENYLLVLAIRYTVQNKEVKKDKKGLKRLRIAQHLHSTKLKKIIALTIKRN